MNWKEFKPTTLFLIKFLGIYLVGNLLYGLFVTAYEPRPDPMTRLVTSQSVTILNVLQWPTHSVDHRSKPTVTIRYVSQNIVSVFEGCNGINVMVVFVAFVFAFGAPVRALLWFIPVGILIIHLSNLLRIILLFFVAVFAPDFMYYSHKYLFTAFIYLVVFLLWMVWIRKLRNMKRE